MTLTCKKHRIDRAVPLPNVARNSEKVIYQVRIDTLFAAIQRPLSIFLTISFILLSSSAVKAQIVDRPSIPATANTTEQDLSKRYLKADNYMPVSAIKPGMSGYGLTVFRGTEVEKFNVQIIGVIRRVLNGKDAILARLSGAELGKNCVIRGMSGSPVYINGKIIGAISFGYEFSKEPIAGITPISEMLDALVVDKNTGRATKIGWQENKENNDTILSTAGANGRMVPLVSPVALIGFSDRAQTFLQKHFQQFGMMVSSGSGGANDVLLSPAAAALSLLKPGGAVSVQLTSGDFSSVVTGTLTGRFGDKIIAFGHPFLGAGSIDFPMSTAFVHQVMPSLSVSFKIASGMKEVGTFFSDRPWACGAKIGAHAKLIPITMQIIDNSRGLTKNYSCQVVDHPDLTPQLVAASAMSAIDATHQTEGPYVATVESALEAEGIAPIHRQDRFSNNTAADSLLTALAKISSAGDPISDFVMDTVSSITNNKFAKSSLKSFHLKVTLDDLRKTADIERIYLEKSTAEPGESVSVSCVIKPYNQPAYTETLNFTVPRDIPDGHLPIGIAGGEDIDTVRNRMGINDPQAESLPQIVDKIKGMRRGDELCLVAALPAQSLIINGVRLNGPPQHWAKILFSNKHTKGPTIAKGEIRAQKLTDWVLNKGHIITVEVKRKDKAQQFAPPSQITSAGTQGDPAMTDLARKTLGTQGKKIDSATTTTQTGGQITISVSAADSASSSTVTSTSSSSGSSSNSTLVPPGSDYPHSRLSKLFRQETEEDFRSGTAEGTIADSWGRIGPAFESIAQVELSAETTIWSSCSSQGKYFYSTADSVWKWAGENAKPELVAKFSTTLTPAICSDQQGCIYAALVPSGDIMQVDMNQSPPVIRKFFHTEEPLIASMTTDDSGNLYVGTAGTGKIYKINLSTKAITVFDTKQAHVLSLYYSPVSNRLLIGTGGAGCVYTLNSHDKLKAIYQGTDHLITGVVEDKAGDIYIASSLQGRLLKLVHNGEIQDLASSEAFFTLHYNPQTNSVYSGDAEGDITLSKVEAISKQPFFIPVAHTEQEEVLTLASSGQQLFAATSNRASLRLYSNNAASNRTYESTVKDAGSPAHWDRVILAGALSEEDPQLNKYLKVETRTGEVSRPDQTWSAWQQCDFDGNSFTINSPPASFLQYKLTWLSVKEEPASKRPGPCVSRVDVTCVPANHSPIFNNISLSAGAFISGKEEISVSAIDPDGDNMVLDIDISDDNGQSWRTLSKALRSKSSAQDQAKKSEPAATPDKTSNEEYIETTPLQTSSINNIAGGFMPKHKLLAASRAAYLDSKSDLPDSKEKSADPKKSSADKNENETEADNKNGNKSKDKEASKKKSKGEIKLIAPTKSSSKTGKSGPTEETFSWIWETTKEKDGNYIVRFTLNDRISSPDDARQTINLRAMVIDNTAPVIKTAQAKKIQENMLSISITAADLNSPIANGKFKIDEEDWCALAFAPGSSGSRTATLTASNIPCLPSAHKILIRITDRAGNHATKHINIK